LLQRSAGRILKKSYFWDFLPAGVCGVSAGSGFFVPKIGQKQSVGVFSLQYCTTVHVFGGNPPPARAREARAGFL
jgi:hypothetical protein